MQQFINIGSRRELFVDYQIIDRMERTRLTLHEPVPGGVSIKLDRYWEGPANFGASVIHHGDRYLMYYRHMKINGEGDGDLCVATSADSVTWTKSALGLVERAGRRDTNIIASDSAAFFNYNSAPWIDTRPGVPEGERIKALTSEPLFGGKQQTSSEDPEGPKRLVAWVSADGLTFHKLTPQPEIVSNLRNCFDGGNTMFWSEAEQAYVLYYRFFDHMRTIARTMSKDFLHWSEPVPMTYGGTPREQFYCNNTQPYFRAPHIYIALAPRFMEGRRVVTEAQVKSIGLLKTPSGGFYGNDCSDAVLLTSRAGSTQYDRTFMEAFVRPGFGAQNWVSRTNYPLTGILPYGPDRIMFFVNRNYMQENWHIERMLLRTDGFASVTAPWSGGEMITKLLTFEGSEMEMNYRTSAAGSVRVEIQDAGGKSIPGYALDECPEIVGDEIERIVRWQGGVDVHKLSGQPVRLRFVMKDADLFALRFRTKHAQQSQ